jgi:hypothetical protein
MFKCRECGKEFDDWHALGGHMRTHREKKETSVTLRTDEELKKERLSKALGKLSEISPQEAWQIVVNWIMDMHRQMQDRDELIQSYRLRLQESESRVQAVQSDLRRLQQVVDEGRDDKGPVNQL